jgi:hypothetical protein
MPNSNGSVVGAIKPKANIDFIQSPFYLKQNNKGSTFFKDQFPYIISGLNSNWH